MRLARLLCSICSLAVAIAGSIAHPQATVSESESAVLYVDAQSGSDSNSGSAASPLKTIQAAVNKANTNNQKSIGTKIIVNAGVYRETVNIDPVSGQTAAPLTIEAATNGTAIISASDLVSGWSPDAQYSGAYAANWTPSESTCPLPSGWPAVQEIALHTEMVFVNGAPMTQVIAYSDLKPGTFYVDIAAGTLHVFPPNGTDPSNATIEAASRAKTISIVGRSNLVLRGLVLEHAASCINTSGATVTSSNNVLLDAIQTIWNNFGGLALSTSTNVTVENSVASYNGGVGFQGTKGQTTLFTNNETDYNNWRGAQATFYNWAMAGMKFFEMRTTTIQNHFSYNNQAQGLWFDTDNQNITINHATLAGSYNAALQLERNEGPITLENSYLCSSGVGVNVLTTQGLTVNNNVFYNNGATNNYQAQFYLAGTAGGISITNWQTGQVYDLVTTGTVLSGNSFIDNATGQFVFGTYLSGSDWTDFTGTLKSGNNTWFDPNTTTAFRIVNGKSVNLSGWQAATGADYSSVWAAPATSPISNCAVPAASYPDFNVSLDNGSYTMSSGVAKATVRVNSFNFGAVNLSITGLPTGVSASFSSPNLVSGFSTLTLVASSTSVANTVPVTLWAISGDRVHDATFNLTVSPNPGVIGTTTSLTTSAASVTQNSPVTLTATVHPASGSASPTGSVTFYGDGAILGTAALSGAIATLSTSQLSVGSNSITAEYVGAGSYSPSTSSPVAVTVNAATSGTTTTLSASTTNLAEGSAVILTASVKASIATIVPTGTVTFYNGTTAIGTGSVAAGVATLTTSGLSVGLDTITAMYSGTSALTSSTSNVIAIQVNPAVVSTSTTLAASTTTVTQGASVTLTATVRPSSGATTPTGTVSFYNGSTLLGSAAVSAGTASIATSSLPTGTNSISAAYSGAVSFNASSSAIVVITVNLPQPTTINTTATLTASATTTAQNSSVTFVATVRPASGTTMPTGTVSFLNGGVSIGSSALVAGVATFTTSALNVGTSTVSASYAGNSSFTPSTSNAISIVVSPSVVNTATTLAVSTASLSAGSAVTLTATVKSASTALVSSGTVTFYIGNAAIGSASVISGAAALSTSSLPAGNDAITAVFGGTATFSPSKSSAVSITVAAALVDTTISLAASANNVVVNSSVTFTASVRSATGAMVSTGSVTFFDGATSLGSAALSSGIANLSTVALSQGQHSITAVYGGSSIFLRATSGPVTITVVSQPATALIQTATTVTSSSPQADQGFTISLTATVAAQSGSVVPTGQVVFAAGTQTIGTASLANGKAYLTTSALPVGIDAVTASYAGDNRFASSTSPAVNVTISGPDFTVEATPGTISITQGENVALTLLVTPKNGFNQNLNLACSGLPSGANCSFGAQAKQSDGTLVIGMTIQTSTATADARGSGMSRAGFSLALLPLIFFISSRRRKEFRKLLSASLLALVIVLAAGSAIGCGVRSAPVSSSKAASSNTSTITVTAKAATGLSHTANIQLTLM